ncbi:hypothetical protein [Marinoscillum pacificum]|uniref:hypothetical protein n=1 Tax=Marinoscillum pacificum TaxID=392723 RepID=UPI002157FAE0|nr:hypothetical protein [Marinoscillum pacificum]
MSKVEYWHKWRFFELLDLLHQAEKLLENYKGGYSGEFLSAEEFHGSLLEEIDNIEFGNQHDLTNIAIWFAPTQQWDDFVGEEGLELGNKIYDIANQWYKSEKGYS